jgi:hypothetical protein
VSGVGSEEEATGARSVSRLLFGAGDTIASTVYGTVVAMATISAAYAATKDAWKVAATAATTAAVLWVAHVYAHGLSERINRGGRLARSELERLARRELGILLAAVLPVAALVLGALGLVREATAVWLALGIGLATLTVEGVRYARLERLGTVAATVAVAGNLALGLLVVVMKVALAH